MVNIAKQDARKTSKLNEYLQYEERLINKRFSWRKRLCALEPMPAAQDHTHTPFNKSRIKRNMHKGIARGDEPPAPKKLGQPMRTIHAVYVPHDSVGAAGNCKQQDTACEMWQSSNEQS